MTTLTPKAQGLRPTPIRRMSRRRLERIARLARRAYSFSFDGATGWASDRRAFLLEVWGREIVDGPHGRCVCGEKYSQPGVCSDERCPLRSEEGAR